MRISLKTPSFDRRVPRRIQHAAWTCALLLATIGGAAPLERNEDALRALRSWSSDQPAAVVREVEALARAAGSDAAARAALARGLESILRGESTADAKDVALRLLAQVGDEGSTAALAPLLLDPRLGHLAAAALGAIPAGEDLAPTKELAQALAKALAERPPTDPPTDPAACGALIEALRRRGDAVALAAVAPVASSEHAALRGAAIVALGDWPGRGGATALRALDPATLGDEATAALHAALLRAAASRLAAEDAPLAAALLRKARSIERSDAERLAGARLAVLVLAGDDPTLLLEMLASERPGWRDTALELVRRHDAPGLVPLAVGVLPLVDAPTRPLLVAALGDRGDPRARSALVALVDDPDPAVAGAACGALAALSDTASVARLLAALDSPQPQIAEAALSALRRVRCEGAEAAMVAALQGTSDAGLSDDAKANVCAALVARGATAAAPAMLALAQRGAPALRQRAVAALTELGGEREVPGLIALSCEAHAPGRADAHHDSERAAILSALVQASRRAEPSRRGQPLVAAIDAAPPGVDGRTVREALVPALGALGGPEALACVARVLANPQSSVEDRRGAVAALASWPDASPAPLLGELFALEGANMAGGSLRGEAFAAWVRALSLDRDAPAPSRLERLEAALRSAASDGERRAVIAALGDVPDRAALTRLRPLLEDPALRTPAMEAMVACASTLPAADSRAALAALRQVAAMAAAQQVALTCSPGAAADVIERGRDFVLSWQVAGPFEKKGAGLAALMDEPFAAESEPDGPRVFWRELSIDDPKRPGVFDLAKALGPGDDRVAYLRTRLYSPFEQRVKIELGSDDGVKLWVNDAAVHVKNAPRGLKPGEDVVTVPLRRGWNTLLAKVTQGGGDWAFCARVRGLDGFAADGVVDLADPRRAEPLPGALVLLDGDDPAALAAWRHRDGSDAKWGLADGGATVAAGSGDLLSRQRFGDCTLHAEFLCPDNPPEVTGQARSNSGIYLQDRYEVQILDAFGEGPASDRVGGIYGRFAPRVNAARRPTVWQDLLIDFTAPRWDERDPANPRKLSNARMTVWLNGVRIHDDVEVEGSTGVGAPEGPADGPLRLQDHGNPVRFRNIWIVPRHGWEGPSGVGFAPLFDGASLAGWTPRGGKAEFRVEDGAIVGETRPNQPNTFLCTDREFDDFVLELEFRIDEALNSGVQVRSAARQESGGERVFGYQCEIDPAQRAWTGGIYDEARRGWLASLSGNPRARAAYQPGEWNRLRVDARGPELRTWVNGVPTAVLWDPLSPRGFIGLQVHGVGDRAEPLNVRWRDLRVRTLPGS